MSEKTIVVTPIGGIPKAIVIEAIKAVKSPEEAKGIELPSNKPYQAAIQLDGFVTGSILLDEWLQVEETPDTIKAMIRKKLDG